MADYQPKIGHDIDIRVLHQHRIEYITLGFGALIVSAFVAFIFFDVAIDGRREAWLSAILACALAATSQGFTGALSVTYRRSGIIAQGTFGFGVFLIVLATTTIARCY